MRKKHIAIYTKPDSGISGSRDGKFSNLESSTQKPPPKESEFEMIERIAKKSPIMNDILAGEMPSRFRSGRVENFHQTEQLAGEQIGVYAIAQEVVAEMFLLEFQIEMARMNEVIV
jgi:hypothetical protein